MKRKTMWYEKEGKIHQTDRILSKEKLKEIFGEGLVRLVIQQTVRRTTQGRKKRTKEHIVRKSKWIRIY